MRSYSFQYVAMGDCLFQIPLYKHNACIISHSQPHTITIIHFTATPSSSHTLAHSWARTGPPPRWRTGSCGPAGWRWCWLAWRAACAAKGRPQSAGALLAPTSWRLKSGFQTELLRGIPVVAWLLRVRVVLFGCLLLSLAYFSGSQQLKCVNRSRVQRKRKPEPFSALRRQLGDTLQSLGFVPEDRR